MAKSSSIDMNAATGDERDIVIPSSFTNFARNEDPFFCPWANKTETLEKEEDGSLEKSELTDHVHGIIGCKEKVTGSNKEKEDDSLKKNESIAVPISDKIIDAPVNAKECEPSSATARNLDMGGSGNVLIKVEDLRPKLNDVNLLVKVVNTKKTCRKSQRRVNVCLVGDETATIKLRVTNNQVDIVKKGSTLILYKAKINIMNDSMELMVPAHGNIQVQQESATFTVKEDNNMSMIRYDVVEVEV